jgi:hypothetical protein
MGDLISPEQYLNILRFQLDHDQKLMKYFEQQKQMEKGKLVAERIPIIISEIEEMINFLKSKK